MTSPDAYTNKWFVSCPHCQSSLTVTDQSASCSACGFAYHHNPAPSVAVIIAQENQLMLAKRAFAPNQGSWDTLGGFLNGGETPDQTVIREVKEESGLDVAITEYLGAIPDVYGDTGIYTINFCYVVEVTGGTPQPADDVAELKWFNLDQVPKNLAFANTRKIVHWYQESRKK
jgi:ADP-ribose pyrophosphatase YjhB (NUDIX family)